MTDVTDDDIALLRAGCEYAGQEQPHERTYWFFDVRGQSYGAKNNDILTEPYASNLLGALMARLRADGWRVRQYQDRNLFKVAVHDKRQTHMTAHTDSPLLALLRAMRDAGIIQTEAKT